MENITVVRLDAWNRLVKLSAAGQTVQENAYDGIRRRTLKKDYVSGALNLTRHFFYSAAWQVLEERVDADTAANRQFVWGIRYIDDLIPIQACFLRIFEIVL